jgi:hypothetical protein
MGAGLNYLIETIVGKGGAVSIYSASGSLYCSRGKGGKVDRLPANGNGAYPGTLVDIQLDERFFVGDDEERGEVEWS